jgi:hypothetical protein
MGILLGAQHMLRAGKIHHGATEGTEKKLKILRVLRVSVVNFPAFSPGSTHSAL